MSLPSDAELVARALREDAAALDALVRRHYGAAYAVALAVTRRPEDAEDVCHEGLVRAAERLEDCRQPERFGAWACAIVRNLARNRVARDPARRDAPLEPERLPARDDAARRVEEGDLRRRLEAALAVLSPMQREVLLLHDLEGWDHGAIAEVIGTSPGMSRQHLFHARRRLRELLGDSLLEDYRHG